MIANGREPRGSPHRMLAKRCGSFTRTSSRAMCPNSLLQRRTCLSSHLSGHRVRFLGCRRWTSARREAVDHDVDMRPTAAIHRVRRSQRSNPGNPDTNHDNLSRFMLIAERAYAIPPSIPPEWRDSVWAMVPETRIPVKESPLDASPGPRAEGLARDDIRHVRELPAPCLTESSHSPARFLWYLSGCPQIGHRLWNGSTLQRRSSVMSQVSNRRSTRLNAEGEQILHSRHLPMLSLFLPQASTACSGAPPP